jgi:hypothetical protein
VQLSVVTADKAYDNEDNHVLVREVIHALSVIPARYEHVPILKTHGRYRKQMKRGYCKLLYNQRNKNEWNYSFSDKTTIWRAHYIKISENTEQRINIQMHSIQHPQIDSSHYNIRRLLLSHPVDILFCISVYLASWVLSHLHSLFYINLYKYWVRWFSH